jgi:hypothetical protein
VDVPSGTSGSLLALALLVATIAWLASRSTRRN